MTKKNIIIIISSVLIISVILGLLYFFGIRPTTTRDQIDNTVGNIQDLANETSLPFPDVSIINGNSEINIEEVNLDPLIISTIEENNKDVIQTTLTNLDGVYNKKIFLDGDSDVFSETEEIEISELPAIINDNPTLNNIVVIKDKKNSEITLPKLLVSDLYEFSYKNVNYWIYKEISDSSLYISLESFENPRQVLISGKPLKVFDIKQVSNGQFYFTTSGDDLNKRLIQFDLNLIPFEKWSNLDFLDEKINSLRLENTLDKDKLEKDLIVFFSKENQEIGQNLGLYEFNQDYRLFNFYPTANGKVFIQVPGVTNQFWLINGDKINLIKLDIAFDAGDGWVTCKNNENICVVYYRDIGLYKIDLNGAEPTAVNVTPTVVDSGDGVVRKNIIRSFDELGRDSEKLLDYEENKVYVWFDGARFILGDFNNKN